MMQTPPAKESADPITKPGDATAVDTKKDDAAPKAKDEPVKAPTKDAEQKPTAAGNGGEVTKKEGTNSVAEPKAKTPEAVEPKPKVAEETKPKAAEQPKPKVAEAPKPKAAEQPKSVPKEAAKEENSKTDSKPEAKEVSKSKKPEPAADEDEPMDTQDGEGDEKKDEKSAEDKSEDKPEPTVEAKEEKPAAKRGGKRKADAEPKEVAVEATTSRPKRARVVVPKEEKEEVEEKRSGRKRAAKTQASMKEEKGSEDDENYDEDEEEEEESEDDEPKAKRRGRPKTAKAAAAKPPKQPKKPKYTGPTIEIPTVEGNTTPCSAGDGEVGQLGIGESGENGKSRFVPIGDVPDKVVRCAAGGMHSLLLTEKGEIFSFGCNDDGSLGRTTENEEDCFVPKVTELSEPVAKIAAGNIHSVAITKNCKVFIWGSYRDNNGAFGIQPEGDAPLKLPTELKVPEPIVDVACGSEHTLLLSNKGTIYSMGVGEQGRLGRLKSSHCGRENRRARQTLLTPVKVPVRKRSIKFDRVWAGRFNTFARSTDGSIWGCGLNNYGQLGELDPKSMEDNFVFFLTPLKSFDPKIKWEQIAGGEQHTLALDAEGSVYSMGRVLYGRLGLGKKDANDPDVTKPTLIPELKTKCTLIAAGDHTSFALDKDGQLWSWGQGTNLLGQGARDDADSIDIFVPTQCTSKTLRDSKVVFASAGSNHALCVVKSE